MDAIQREKMNREISRNPKVAQLKERAKKMDDKTLQREIDKAREQFVSLNDTAGVVFSTLGTSEEKSRKIVLDKTNEYYAKELVLLDELDSRS